MPVSPLLSSGCPVHPFTSQEYARNIHRQSRHLLWPFQEDTQREEADLLRTQAVEALLNLMNTAMDLVSHTWRSYPFTQHSLSWDSYALHRRAVPGSYICVRLLLEGCMSACLGALVYWRCITLAASGSCRRGRPRIAGTGRGVQSH